MKLNVIWNLIHNNPVGGGAGSEAELDGTCFDGFVAGE